ncbi:acyl-CoA ligase FadD12 [Mycobacterium kyogaense]|uniref:acyl-CoA ligase FadD12 n=1 Tax=Mycobacterium kyogaense TaxID=2212479 RepID=UPI000DAC55F5|nr:acyl-CoA ligase FadD12 [Mycobacterium kyogaense]
MYETVGTLVRTRLLVPMRPDKYIRVALSARNEKLSNTVGLAASAIRCPDRLGLVDDIGSLTWKQIDDRCNALAAGLQALPGAKVNVVGVMCRNHRGFIEAVAAANRIGANVLLLNTSFAGPALAEVVKRENVDTLIYDEEFASTVGHSVEGRPDIRQLVAWADERDAHRLTVEKMIADHFGHKPEALVRGGRLILLTSGTTGLPKGAQHSGGGANTLTAVLNRTPWRAEEATVVAAPMFHAWGFSQLVLSALMACTIVTRRKFDPEATLKMVDRYDATGLSIVPVMLDRIMELPAPTLDMYSCRSLRFASASGSRMRPDVVTSFMDRFGDIVYNNYNATEVGMIASATPQDLRVAPDTAGTAVDGTEIRILDPELNEVSTGQVGTVFVRNSTLFDGYTTGSTKQYHEGFMSSGDLGRLDESGRLFVVGRDDEMIVSGGENVYPIEVERALTNHEHVAEAAVIGVDDDRYGQRLAAFVVLRPGVLSTPEALKDHVRSTLASYKVPRKITLLDELPRVSTGKIARMDLQALVQPDHNV